MEIAYLRPTNQYAFFESLVPSLEARGHRVTNFVTGRPDVVLAAILPITHEYIRDVEWTTAKVVLWHWDLYSFTDYAEPRWAKFLDLLPRANDIWSCTYEVARQLKEQRGLDSYMMPAWVEMSPQESRIGDYAFYAASSGGFGKRVEWAERACKMLNIPLKLTMNQRASRGEYEQTMARCRVYVMTAFEESNGTIPAMEAAMAGKALVLADLPASREVFGSTAYYFKNDDFRSLLDALSEAWERGPKLGVRSRMVNLYERSAIHKRITDRLEYVNASSR